MDSLSPILTHQKIATQFADQGRVDRFKREILSEARKTDEELKKVSAQFESIFISHLLKSMRKTIPKTGMFDSYAMDTFESMMDQELAKVSAKKKGIGLQDMIYRELRRLNQNANGENENPDSPTSTGYGDLKEIGR